MFLEWSRVYDTMSFFNSREGGFSESPFQHKQSSDRAENEHRARSFGHQSFGNVQNPIQKALLCLSILLLCLATNWVHFEGPHHQSLSVLRAFHVDGCFVTSPAQIDPFYVIAGRVNHIVDRDESLASLDFPRAIRERCRQCPKRSYFVFSPSTVWFDEKICGNNLCSPSKSDRIGHTLSIGAAMTSVIPPFHFPSCVTAISAMGFTLSVRHP